MRDPKRIDDFCDRLKAVWHTVPDWRFGQLMVNLLGDMKASGRDPFFPEDIVGTMLLQKIPKLHEKSSKPV